MLFAFRQSEIWKYVLFSGLMLFLLWLHPKAADAPAPQAAFLGATQVAYSDSQVQSVTILARRKSR